MTPITRLTAAREGRELYTTGKPCRYGHHAPREVKAGDCVECAKVRKRRLRSKRGRSIALTIAAQGMPDNQDDADFLRLDYYRTGKRCHKDHDAPRYTSGGGCVECYRERSKMPVRRVVTRKDAESRGLKRFYTGRPCQSGHNAPRYTSSGTCVECAAATKKKWRSINREPARMKETPARGARAQAANMGLTRYNGSQPCRSCGGTTRLVTNGKCADCQDARPKDPRPPELDAAALWHRCVTGTELPDKPLRVVSWSE